MLFGQGCLIASQLLLMLAPKFWVMCIGRFIEGIASAVIMTAGLALICDTTPEKAIGSQLGIAMIGMPFGGLVGPPVGGALYDRWGYRAPFIFSILFTLFDVACRLLVVEKPANERTLAISVDQSPTVRADVLPEQRTIAVREKEAATSEDTPNSNLEGQLSVCDGGSLVEAPQISALGILVQFARSPRMLTSLLVVFICSFAFSAADVAIPLRLQDIWHFDSRKVGLAYLAAIIPTLISNPLAGSLSDWCGPQWIAILFIVCGTPWWGAMTTTFSLPFFIVSFGIENFFIGAVAPPITSELAAVTKIMKGVGYAHTYGTFNMVLGVANAVGSIVAGQVYGHSRRGWDILCYIHTGLLGFALLAVMLFIGETPFLRGGWKLKNAPFRRGAAVDASQETSDS
ncbi:major facilitator superfamily domain-containing protein [Fomitopsis betulina]|nr:major facilitator superfamily domain-containing protein [Fomitopsis betulina]